VAVSLACEKLLAYTASVVSADGDELTVPMCGMNGMSPEAPAQPVPDRWVRLKPRMRVTL
jgi:hypothetical protein